MKKEEKRVFQRTTSLPIVKGYLPEIYFVFDKHRDKQSLPVDMS